MAIDSSVSRVPPREAKRTLVLLSFLCSWKPLFYTSFLLCGLCCISFLLSTTASGTFAYSSDTHNIIWHSSGVLQESELDRRISSLVKTA